MISPSSSRSFNWSSHFQHLFTCLAVTSFFCFLVTLNVIFVIFITKIDCDIALLFASKRIRSSMARTSEKVEKAYPNQRFL